MKHPLAIIISGGILAGTVLGMLLIGSAAIDLRIIASVLVKQIFPAVSTTEIPSAVEKIIWNIRWPRIALALLVGSSLAVSGACYQAMFRNPLADPFILGVSSGAALGAAIAIVFKLTSYISFFAFLGGITAIFIVYGLGRVKGGGINTNQLLLAGVAFGSMLNAILSLIMVLHTQQIGAILFWLLGSLSNPPASLVLIAGMVAAGMAVIMLYVRDLDIMTAGEENAQFLGVDVVKVKVILLLSTTLITSVVVAVSGVIGFIGLIVPHLLRKIVGPQHHLLIPLCALWGAIFLLWADGITRMVNPLAQVPVGVITALLGSPFFLYILYSSGRK
ncbi:FecCD family ABC transporter permease [Thermosinus carboxydivorans]|nr:iron ABC transporter permease [Thermosinus carboxydivorans]